MEFPLSPGFFPAVRLSPAESQAYAQRAEPAARSLLRLLRDPNWRKVSTPVRGVEGGATLAKMLRIDVDATAAACLLVCGSSLAPGSVREVVEAIGSTDSDEYRRAMAFVHESRFLDAVSLCNVDSESNKASTTTTIKWAAFRDRGRKGSLSGPPSSSSIPSAPSSASAATVDGTDYCFLEHTGVLVDDTNAVDNVFSPRTSPKKKRQTKTREVGFVVQESIDRAREVPSFAAVGLRRGDLRRAGTLVLPTSRPGVVQVSTVLQVFLDPNSSVDGAASSRRQSVIEQQLLRRVASVSRVELLLERRRLARVRRVSKAEWIADELRRSCAVCDKVFALRRRKHHCRVCGEVVCASCSPMSDACGIRVCTKCLLQTRRSVDYTAIPAVKLHQKVEVEPQTPEPKVEDNVVAKTDSDRAASCVDRSSESSDGSNFSIAFSESIMSIRECGWMPEDRPQSAWTANAQPHFVSRVPSRFAGVPSATQVPHIGVITPASLSSSRSSSSYSLSDMDTFEDLLSVHNIDHNVDDSHSIDGDLESVDEDNQLTHNHQGSVNDVLERIRSMREDLSALSSAYPRMSQLPSTSGFARPPLEATVDVDYISTSNDFNLLRPESLLVSNQQDAGEKSRRSNLSSFTGSTVLDLDDYEDDSDSDESDDGVDRIHPQVDRIRRNSQAELLALRQQVEGLYRSLEAATNKLQTYEAMTIGVGARPSMRRKSSRRQDRELDPSVRKSYEALVAELHELMGLPTPGK